MVTTQVDMDGQHLFIKWVPAALIAAVAMLVYWARQPTAAPVAAHAERCATVGPRDALLVVHMQNDFLDERSADGSYANGDDSSGYSPAYEIEPTPSGMIPRGKLAVRGSGVIVPVVNHYLSEFAARGAGVFVTLDWHPPDHCSFCRFGQDQTDKLDCTWGCDSELKGNCVTGAGVPLDIFNWTTRCLDPISEKSFQESHLLLWPDHGVEGTFGARLDPYLRVPEGAQFIKVGYNTHEDEYDTLKGYEALSDDTATRSDLLLQRTLRDVLKSGDYERVFVAGLATDMVVKSTLLSILESGPDANKEDRLGSVRSAVLLTSAGMGVFDAPGDFYGSDPATLSAEVKRDLRARGAHLVHATEIHSALDELCEGTCDTDRQCLESGSFCDKAEVERGSLAHMCAQKPIVETLLRDLLVGASLMGVVVLGFFFQSELVMYAESRHKRANPPEDEIVVVETDIEGSSAIWEAMSEKGQADIMKDKVMDVHDRVMRSCIETHFGWELYVRGDAFVIAFHNVLDALAFCLDVQDMLLAAEWPQELVGLLGSTMDVLGTDGILFHGLRVRMGIHQGRYDERVTKDGKLIYFGEVMTQTTAVADSGNGGQILMSQAVLPLPTMPKDCCIFDMGIHELDHFQGPTRLVEIYRENLAPRHFLIAKLKTKLQMTPSFNQAPDGDVTVVFTGIVGLADLQRDLPADIVESALNNVFDTLRRVMFEFHGYDCRGAEPDGNNLYAFASYAGAVYFACAAQKAILELPWDQAILEHPAARQETDEEGNVLFSGFRLKMGMHSGNLKRIRIPATGRADYYGESANRAARVAACGVGGQVVCVQSEVVHALKESQILNMKSIASSFEGSFAADAEHPYRPPPGIPFDVILEDMGRFSLKGIPGLVSLSQVSVTKLAARTRGAFKEGGKVKQVHAPEKDSAPVIFKASENTSTWNRRRISGTWSRATKSALNADKRPGAKEEASQIKKRNNFSALRSGFKLGFFTSSQRSNPDGVSLAHIDD